ncbi:hypothetical protein ScPMuIL_014260 [Solemya velum]
MAVRVARPFNFVFGRYCNLCGGANPSVHCKFNAKTSSRGVSTTPFPEFANDSSIRTHDDLHKLSIRSPEIFWGRLARSRLSWAKDFNQVLDCDLKRGHIRWFLDGRINASVNCVDRHLEKKGDQIALIWEKDEPGTQEYVTYRELSKMVNKISNVLKRRRVKRGDRVAIYLPKSPIAIASMLACARIGAIHNVVFAGFSAEALAGRIQDATAGTVITADQGLRGGKTIALKKTVDEAVAKCPSVKQVLVYQRTGAEVPMGKLDSYLEKEMELESDRCDPVDMNSEENLFMLYTSGSTGKPKGIAHTHGGYLLYTNVSFKHVFDYQDAELFGCVADIGWITGHSYVLYGPLSNGATTLLFESTPLYPNPGRYWEMVERLKLNHIYLAPTALRMLLKAGDSWVKKYDRSSLRVLGCEMTTTNNSAILIKLLETGGICISPRPSNPGAEIIPAMPMRPFFGIEPVIMDPKGNELKGDNVQGSLCMKSPWPGAARTVYGDHDRYIQTYFSTFPGYYCTGDGAKRINGNFQITGRMDDVLNISGHRLGTAEIEDALDDHPCVAETAVVGFPHDVKGEGMYVYVVLKDDISESEDEMSVELRERVKTNIGGFAQPDRILFIPALPKTRSGKIMRRILRKVAADSADELGDVSTLYDPSVVEDIISKHEDTVRH